MAATALQQKLRVFREEFCVNPEATDFAALDELVREMRRKKERVLHISVMLKPSWEMGQRLAAVYMEARKTYPDLPPLHWNGPNDSPLNTDAASVAMRVQELNEETMAATRNNPFASALAGLRVSA